jgi:Tol biopolymer transport system component
MNTDQSGGHAANRCDHVETVTSIATPRRLLAILAASVMAGGLLVIASAPSQAAFPGVNGLIAYVSDGRPDVGPEINDDIYVLRPVTGESGTADYVSVRLTTHSDNDRQPAVSPDGKQIAFVRGTGNPQVNATREVYVMDAKDDDGDGEGDNLRRLTDNGVSDAGPAWSPDGQRIVFQSNRDGNNELYVMDADGTDVVRLTNDPASDSQPVFFPDGTKIAFSTVRTGDSEVFVMNADGSSPVNVTNRPDFVDGFADFSPDGAKIAFAASPVGALVTSNQADLFVINLDGTGLINLTSGLVNAAGQRTNERWPAWSPDGSKIAVWAGIDFGTLLDSEIYAVNADGSGTPVNLTNNQASDVEPDWGPAPDADNDGVSDANDQCSATVLPESFPELKVNRFAADIHGNFIDANEDASGYTITDTGGCSAEQIIAAAGLGTGHTRYGITRSALDAWVTTHP